MHPGDFVLDPDALRLPDATGHFVNRFIFEGLGPPNGRILMDMTQAARTTADGTKISLHFVSFSLDMPPQVTLSFHNCG